LRPAGDKEYTLSTLCDLKVKAYDAPLIQHVQDWPESDKAAIPDLYKSATKASLSDKDLLREAEPPEEQPEIAIVRITAALSYMRLNIHHHDDVLYDTWLALHLHGHALLANDSILEDMTRLIHTKKSESHSPT
jgi:hypothetical protein